MKFETIGKIDLKMQSMTLWGFYNMKLFKALNIASRKVVMNEVFFYQQILANLWLGHCNALFSLF